MKTILVCLLTILTTQLQAGASNAKLTCKATNTGGSGVSIEANIPGDFAEFDFTLSNKDGKFNWSQADGAALPVTAFSKGVFTFVLQLKSGQDLALYALPKTIKAKGGDSRLVDATFDALLLRAPRPGHDPKSLQDAYIRNVPLRCSFHHSI
jgi:hypothetical protein